MKIFINSLFMTIFGALVALGLLWAFDLSKEQFYGLTLACSAFFHGMNVINMED